MFDDVIYNRHMFYRDKLYEYKRFCERIATSKTRCHPPPPIEYPFLKHRMKKHQMEKEKQEDIEYNKKSDKKEDKKNDKKNDKKSSKKDDKKKGKKDDKEDDKEDEKEDNKKNEKKNDKKKDSKPKKMEMRKSSVNGVTLMKGIENFLPEDIKKS